MSETLQIVQTVAITLGVIVGGIFALASIFNKERNARTDSIKRTDDEYIKGLEGKIKAFDDYKTRKDDEMATLLRDFGQMKSDYQNVLAENSRLVGENVSLKQLIQGRDPSTTEYQKRAIGAIEKIGILEALELEQSNVIQKAVETMEKQGKLLQTLFKMLEDHDKFVKKAHPEIVE